MAGSAGRKIRLRHWVTALRSDEFSQTQHCMYDGNGMCCMGVANVEVFDAAFHKDLEGDWADDLGHMYSLAPTRAQLLGLDEQIGDAGVSYLDTLSNLPEFAVYNRRTSVGSVLITLNDNGFTFEQIADVIEALLLDGQDGSA